MTADLDAAVDAVIAAGKPVTVANVAAHIGGSIDETGHVRRDWHHRIWDDLELRVGLYRRLVNGRTTVWERSL